MASQVEIVNNALIKLGEDRITSMSDPDKPATLASAVWDVKRDAELAAHPWTFATARAALPASATAPAFGWAFSYPLPAGFLAMVEVGEDYVLYRPDEARALFTIEGGAILCDEASPLRIRYVQQVTNTGLWPALFAEAMACRLAVELCEALTQSGSKKQQLRDEYRDTIRAARRANAIELPPQPVPESIWLAQFR